MLVVLPMHYPLMLSPNSILHLQQNLAEQLCVVTQMHCSLASTCLMGCDAVAFVNCPLEAMLIAHKCRAQLAACIASFEGIHVEIPVLQA